MRLNKISENLIFTFKKPVQKHNQIMYNRSISIIRHTVYNDIHIVLTILLPFKVRV